VEVGREEGAEGAEEDDDGNADGQELPGVDVIKRFVFVADAAAKERPGCPDICHNDISK
jgi:hypothetical protein